MSNSLDTLFTGDFYIDRRYGVSLVPSLVSMYTGKASTEKPENEKIQNVTKIYLSATSSVAEANTALNNSSNKVVVLDFKQPVVKYSTYYWLGTQTYITILQRLKNDPTVVGVVIDIDTGGGQVYGTPEMYDTVADFKNTKPIGFYTNGYLCSGGYYIAAPGSFIMANKRADAIGSIGGCTIIVDYNGLLEKFGAKVHTIYSDLSPDKNKGYRAVVDGSDSDYSSYIKEDLNPMVSTFHVDMKNARPQLNEEVFKGGTWTGDTAIGMGLIDKNGTLLDAIAEVFQEASNNNSNTNITMNTKELPQLQSVLGLNSPLASTEEKGTYLNADQLDAIESRFVELENSNTSLQTDLDAAKSNTELNEKLTASQSIVSAVETSIDSMLTSAGLDVKGTLTEKTAALSAKVTEMGKADGSKPTVIKVKETADSKNDFVDSNASHNQIANSIKS
ncbi:S49 family peptidase [Flavobacterium sp. F52]|uniref:S49 family peptidase n=1 Tax=Flavobacterium sp. F52 TaxID=1202532 RepID=UPI000272DFCC|nr:S49 family peptidase [Flavobacterium sp. F52]EJG02276.1 peptidase S49 [Flavobacterium sp. F52]